MWGTTKGRLPAGTGVAEPRVTGVVGDRTGRVWLILVSRWASTIASNWALSPMPVEGGRRHDPRTTTTQPYHTHAALYP